MESGHSPYPLILWGSARSHLPHSGRTIPYLPTVLPSSSSCHHLALHWEVSYRDVPCSHHPSRTCRHLCMLWTSLPRTMALVLTPELWLPASQYHFLQLSLSLPCLWRTIPSRAFRASDITLTVLLVAPGSLYSDASLHSRLAAPSSRTPFLSCSHSPGFLSLC